jgi:hypothetical protein
MQSSAPRQFYRADGGGRGDSKPVFEKSREILRHVYQCNPSGSKILSVGCDPGQDFEAVVNISKPGFPGVKIDQTAWFGLLGNAPYLFGYFRGEVGDGGRMQLSNRITLSFKRSYNKPVVDITTDAQTPGERTVTFALATWEYIYDISSLVGHVLERLNTVTPYVNQLFADIVNHTANTCRSQNGQNLKLDEVTDFLKNKMALEDIPTYPEENDLFYERKRAFYELKQFCVFDIAGNLNRSN